MAEKSEADLVKLAFELLAERGWERFSFAELARRAELPLAQVYAEVPDRPALLRLLGRRLDAEMLAIDMAELDGMSPRERVFELIMRRLDAMAPYKEGLRTLARKAGREPMLLAAACCNLDRLSRRLLDAAATRREPGHDNEVGTACDGGGLSAGVSGLARRRHAGHGAHPGRTRPPPAAGGDSSPVVGRLQPVLSPRGQGPGNGVKTTMCP